MNNLIKTAVKLSGYRTLLKPCQKIISANLVNQRQLARNLWYMCNSKNDHKFTILKEPSYLCTCGCGGRGVHSKAVRELVEFLTEEILAEKKAQKSKSLPTEIDGFNVSLNGASVSLSKKEADEEIKISFNVNHTVDTETEPEIDVNADKPELGELKSKPDFKIEIKNNNSTTLALVCSFISDVDQEEGYNDIFGIDELSIYSNECNENVYAVAGEVMDSCLYDLLLNYLEEKGITNEFVDKISDFSTKYEHAAYIGLLEGLSKFVSGK